MALLGKNAQVLTVVLKADLPHRPMSAAVCSRTLHTFPVQPGALLPWLLPTQPSPMFPCLTLTPPFTPDLVLPCPNPSQLPSVFRKQNKVLPTPNGPREWFLNQESKGTPS